MMAVMEDNHVTNQANNQLLEIQCERRREKEELKQEFGLENTQDDYIEALTSHRICYSHKCCKTATEVTNSFKAQTYKKDKLEIWKDNI